MISGEYSNTWMGSGMVMSFSACGDAWSGGEGDVEVLGYLVSSLCDCGR